MSDKPLLRALRGEKSHTPPIWFMRQAGRYLPEYRQKRAEAGGFLDMCYNPAFATEVTLQPIRRYGMDGAILFSDILVVAHALGADVRFVEGEGPKLTPIRTAAGLDALDPSRLHGHLAPVYQAVRQLRAALPAETTLIGFAGAPWTVAAYMIEGAGSKEWPNTRYMAYAERALFARLIDMLTDATADYLGAQIEAGAEAVQIFDSWAGVLPEGEFEAWGIAPVARIVAQLRARHPDVPILAFPRGVGVLYRRFAQAVPVDGLSLDTTVPIAWAADTLDVPCLQGNLDPLLLRAGGPRLDAEVDRIVGAYADRPYIFNLGHGVLPETDPAHVAQVVDRLRAKA
ncbi:MAG: uroporphyrinogen decarboxylase [Geminicoccaceae bacterium]